MTLFFEILHFQEASWTRLLGAEGSGVISGCEKSIQNFGENTCEGTIEQTVKKQQKNQKIANVSSLLESR